MKRCHAGVGGGGSDGWLPVRGAACQITLMVAIDSGSQTLTLRMVAIDSGSQTLTLRMVAIDSGSWALTRTA